MKLKTQNGFAPILVLAVVLVGLVGAATYVGYLNWPKRQVVQPTVSPTSTTNTAQCNADLCGRYICCDTSKANCPLGFPKECESCTKDICTTTNETANWKTYTSSSLGISFKYSTSFRVSENYEKGRGLVDDGIFVDFNQAEGMPSKWLHITTSEKNSSWGKMAAQLYSTPVGKVFIDQSFPERKMESLANMNIGDLTGHLFVEKEPYEGPRPLRTLVVNKDNIYYIIQFTYSNYPPNISDTPGYDIDYIKTFDQILSTFKFTQ